MCFSVIDRNNILPEAFSSVYRFDRWQVKSKKKNFSNGKAKNDHVLGLFSGGEILHQFGLSCFEMILAPWRSRCLWLAAISPLWCHTNIFLFPPTGDRGSNVICCQWCAWVCVRRIVINGKIKGKKKWDKVKMRDKEREERMETHPAAALTFPLWPPAHKFRLDYTVSLVRQTGSSQDLSRRLKQDLRWCWLCSVVTGVEQHGELDCCCAQFSSFFSLAGETAALPRCGHSTSTCLTLVFLIRAWNQRLNKKQLSDV